MRTSNQDAALVHNVIIRDGVHAVDYTVDADDDLILCAVADGMGGHAAGDVASLRVCEALAASSSTLDLTTDCMALASRLQHIIEQVHAELRTAGAQSPELAGMGSTLTALLLVKNRALSIHVGDSRLYRLRDGLLTQLTRDHTVRELTGDESVPANLIANSVGGGDTIFVETQDLSARIHHEDVFLLCSDGIPLHLDDLEIEHILHSGGNGSDLCAAAMAAGGSDNVSAIRIDIGQQAE